MADTDETPASSRRPFRRLAAAAVALIAVVTAVQVIVAVLSARSGLQAVDRAREALSSKDYGALDRHLVRAESALGRTETQLGSPNPVFLLARVVPYVRHQFRAVRILTESAHDIATAGALLSGPARATLSDDRVDRRELAGTVARARSDAGAAARIADRATGRLTSLQDLALLPALADARSDGTREIEEAAEKVQRASAAVTVAAELLGAGRPTRFLLLSQNPDEPRPGGGYMGTYGVLEADEGTLALRRYGGMGDWNRAHRTAAVDPQRAPYVFRRVNEPQYLGNANTLPDWPSSAAQAEAIWRAGGEPPLDGVITYLPGALVRILRGLGPVRVPGYPETVTAQNLDRLLEFYTHREDVYDDQNVAVRKRFIADLARVLLDQLQEAEPETLRDVVFRLAEGAKAGEAAVWSKHDSTQPALHRLGIDGAFPAASGDFYAYAEFAYASKNGRSLERVFTHDVTLRPDGSGTSATTVDVRNTAPRSTYNYGNEAFLSPFGPAAGRLVPPSDPMTAPQVGLAGHPSGIWRRIVQPLGKGTLTTVWDAPQLMQHRGAGAWEYRLTFLPTPGHRGDRLRLTVTLPTGWRWRSAPPPSDIALDQPFRGSWLAEAP